MCYIIQVCCISCNKFISFRICPIKNYMEFIKESYDDYKDFTYYIYYGNACCDVIDGVIL